MSFEMIKLPLPNFMFSLLMALQKPEHLAALFSNERTVLGQTCEHTNFSINYLLLVLSFVYC